MMSEIPAEGREGGTAEHSCPRAGRDPRHQAAPPPAPRWSSWLPAAEGVLRHPPCPAGAAAGCGKAPASHPPPARSSGHPQAPRPASARLPAHPCGGAAFAPSSQEERAGAPRRCRATQTPRVSFPHPFSFPDGCSRLPSPSVPCPCLPCPSQDASSAPFLPPLP